METFEITGEKITRWAEARDATTYAMAAENWLHHGWRNATEAVLAAPDDEAARRDAQEWGRAYDAVRNLRASMQRAVEALERSER